MDASPLLTADRHWGMEPDRFEAYRAQIERLEPKAAYWSEDEEEKRLPYLRAEGVAVLDVTGTLVKNLSWWSWYTRDCSTSALGDALRQAAGDDQCQAILMRFDSPGGQVGGTGALAAEVARIDATEKPVYAYVTDQCCSAAYWIASQCREIHASETALIGAIGTYMVLYDYSKALEKNGVKAIVVKAGDMKGAGVPGTEITDAHLDDFQRLVNALNARFTAAVAKGRSFSEEDMASLADGRLHVGQAAVDLGLADKIGSEADCLRMLQEAHVRSAPYIW